MSSSPWRRVEKLSISLPVELAEEVREAVGSGRFTSVSEVIREALRDWRLTRIAVDARRRRPPPCTDIRQLQLADIISGASFRRITRFAIRGSAQKRVVEAAVRFQPPLQYGLTIDEARRDLQNYLTYHWLQVVNLVLLDSVDDPTEWTIVYDADLPGSETDSSSTS